MLIRESHYFKHALTQGLDQTIIQNIRLLCFHKWCTGLQYLTVYMTLLLSPINQLFTCSFDVTALRHHIHLLIRQYIRSVRHKQIWCADWSDLNFEWAIFSCCYTTLHSASTYNPFTTWWANPSSLFWLVCTFWRSGAARVVNSQWGCTVLGYITALTDTPELLNQHMSPRLAISQLCTSCVR